MKKIKPHERNGDSLKHPPTLKKENKRKVEKKEVNQALIENVEHRLEKFHSIVIDNNIEVFPFRDEEHFETWLERDSKEKSRRRDEIQNTTDGIFKPQRYLMSRYIEKSELNDKPWVLKQVDLGLRIAKFKKTQSQELVARTIRDYPEVLFYDDADIILCLYIALNPSELIKFIEEPREKNRISIESFLYNPFREQVLNWHFLNRWGNRQEQEAAKKYLKESGLGAFTHFLRRGKPPGSGISKKEKKKEVRETYNTILRYFQEHFKAEGKPRDNVDKIKMLRGYITRKNFIGFFHTHIESQEKDDFWKAEKIAKKLLGIDASKINNAKAWGKRGKKNEEEKTKTIHPFNPSNIALHLTGLIYNNISPDTVRTAIYRK